MPGRRGPPSCPMWVLGDALCDLSEAFHSRGSSVSCWLLLTCVVAGAVGLSARVHRSGRGAPHPASALKGEATGRPQRHHEDADRLQGAGPRFEGMP